MSASDVISLVCSIVALIGTAISFIINKINDIKQKRIFPIISILDSEKDNIKNRLSNMNARIVNVDNFKSETTQYAYICVNNFYDYKMINCSVAVDGLCNLNVGTIIPNKSVIIPLPISNPIVLKCNINYITEENEVLEYIVKFNFPEMSNRIDEVYLKGKKILTINKNLCESMNPQEFLTYLDSIKVKK